MSATALYEPDFEVDWTAQLTVDRSTIGSDATVGSTSRSPQLASLALSGAVAALLTVGGIGGLFSGTSTSSLAGVEVRLGGLGTSTAAGPGSFTSPASSGDTATLVEPRPDSEAVLVKWLYEQSGLTWDQLARAFGVSRRAVHLWASGGRMNAANQQALRDFYGVVQALPSAKDRDARRNALLALDEEGLSIVDRIRLTRSESAGSVQGSGYSFDQLVGALHDDAANRG